jgi:dihydrofolate synthase/folylpolyglutamate synthase
VTTTAGGGFPEEATLAADRYEATLAWLLSLEATRGMDFKLERVRRALDAVGSPQQRFRTIHVAGTNGKGSVSATAESILRAAGVRTGLYTSPHLVDFCERIRVAGSWIDRAAVVDHVEHVRSRHDVAASGLTFFELTTIVAFLEFARAQVDVAVIEVGLGGRLDATNVIDGDVAVITSIGFDHEAFLGDTLDAIAREKAGILRAGRPALIGRLPAPALAAVLEVAGRVKAPVLRLGHEFDASAEPDGLRFTGPQRSLAGLRPSLRGAHQVDNTALAIAAVDALALPGVDAAAIRAGVTATRWPGRLETVCGAPLVVLDAAHNPDGVRVLAAELGGLAGARRIHLVFGVLADKRWPEMVDTIAPRVGRVTVVRVPVARSEDPEVVARRFAEYCPADVVEDPREATLRAIAGASRREDAVVVAGSVFLIGAVHGLFDAKDAPAGAAGDDGARREA